MTRGSIRCEPLVDTGSVVPKRTLRKRPYCLLLSICVPVYSCSPRVARTERGRTALSQEWTATAKSGPVHSELTRQLPLHTATGRSFRKLHIRCRECTLTSQKTEGEGSLQKPPMGTDNAAQPAPSSPSHHHHQFPPSSLSDLKCHIRAGHWVIKGHP